MAAHVLDHAREEGRRSKALRNGMSMTRCPGCNEPVPDIEGPVHAYVPSAPGCWRVFGEVQADESLRFGYPPEHRLVVDAYMAQHPGDGRARRDRQSVFVHLVALCAVLDSAVPRSTSRACSVQSFAHVTAFRSSRDRPGRERSPSCERSVQPTRRLRQASPRMGRRRLGLVGRSTRAHPGRHQRHPARLSRGWTALPALWLPRARRS
jgi:Family of unknown function (DUF5946)